MTAMIDISIGIKIAQRLGVEICTKQDNETWQLSARLMGDEIGDPFITDNVPNESNTLAGVVKLLILLVHSSVILGSNDCQRLQAQLPPQITLR